MSRLPLKLKISQKGLILVLVPLLFETLLLVTLVIMLDQAEAAVQRAEYARAVIAKSNGLLQLFSDAGATLFAYAISKSSSYGEHFDETVKLISRESQALEEMTRGDPIREESVRKILPLSAQAVEQLSALRSILRPDADELDRLHVPVLKRKLEATLAQLRSELRQCVARQEEQNAMAPADAARARERVRDIILLGVVLNVVIAVAMAGYFSRSITRRLSTLMDNTEKLSAEQSLNPPLSGADEIAELDKVFHKMALTLAEAMRKERAMIANAIDVICSIDADGKFVSVSPASLQAWGFTPQELAGRFFLDLAGAESTKETLRAFRDAVDKKVPISFENRILRADGSLMDVLWSAHWVDEEQSLFCVAHDISQRKEMERLKQQFVAMISHDLRTPLTAIQAVFDLLIAGAYGPLSDSGFARVNAAHKNSKRLISLVNNLMDLEKLEAGKMKLECAYTSLPLIVGQSVESVRDFADKRGVTIDCDPADIAYDVYADEFRAIQVLVNLLSNAIKFSPSQGVIRIRANQQDAVVKVSVQDEGRGVPPEFRQSIFERFSQVAPADAAEKSGTGLGLPICKAIVQEHGGEIGVESEIGKGSTFWFTLPVSSAGKSMDPRLV